MAQAGYTPIQLYYSNSTGTTPASLANGELAINQFDGKLYYRNNAGVVTQFNPSVTAVTTISFGTTGLTPSTASSGVVTVAGTLGATSGGTGQSTYAAGDLIYASATNTLSKLTAGTNGYVLTLSGGLPVWAASTGGVTSFQTSLSGLTPSTSTTGAITLAGTLGATSGGTSISTYATGDIIYASATNTLSKLTAGTNGYVLTLAGGVPTWAASTGGVTSFSAGTTGFTPNTASTGAITLAGTLNAVNGGTSFSTYATGDIIYASATNTLSKLAAGTNGYVLTLAGGVPTWAAGGSGGVTTISFGSTGLTPATATSGAVTVAGTLGAGYGGTGLSTFAVGDIMYASATTPTISKLALGTAYQIMGVNAGATAPSWQGLSSLIDNGLSASTQGQILYRGASAWVPLAVGSSGQVLTSGGAGANVSWTTPAGGITGFTAALNTAAPNATDNVSSLTASGGTTNQYLAIVPKGNGGIIAAIPNSLASGGNVRGTYAVDLQTARSNANEVASGANSVVLGGERNRAYNSYGTVVGGLANTAGGQYGGIYGGAGCSTTGDGATILGGNSSTSVGQNTTILTGFYVSDRGVRGGLFWGDSYNAGSSSVGSGAQSGEYRLGQQTTDATTSYLVSSSGAASTFNQVWLRTANTAYVFTALVVASVNGSPTQGNTKAWRIEGCIKRGATNADTTLVGSVAVNIVAADAGASSWTATAIADTTNGALSIQVVGQAATTIRWSCRVITSEVGTV